MDINRVKYIINEHLCDGITKDTMLLWLDNLNDEAKQGEKYRHIVVDVETMLLPGYFVTGAPELEQFRRLYKETKEKYFLKPKTRRQRINNIMTKMRDLGIAKNDIINMLIELRDEEEKV